MKRDENESDNKIIGGFKSVPQGPMGEIAI